MKGGQKGKKHTRQADFFFPSLFFSFVLFAFGRSLFSIISTIQYEDEARRGEAGQGEKRANDAWFKERLEPMEESFALELYTLKMQSNRHPLDQSSPDTVHSMTRQSDREDTPVTLTMETYSKEGQGTGASTKD
ncbi:hypothetical protein K457DRAFT_637815 [Linnemannia elongata AG-77]|uniref:Uncharacterized protein n=1 Tax=Linnemannia elongata AG-77 TaxID=1314771 RepID=A0A197JPU0_9FUNG|nr:hypothetical protein K457DRAFT_637815 [Linnemannia elongata AG-77]